MATGAVIARILTQYSDKGSKQAQKDIQKLGKNIDAMAKKATKAFAVAAAASAAFAIKIGKDAVQGAIEDAKSANVLANTLKNVTGATQDAIDATELYLKEAEKVSNLTGEELRQSLGSLVVSTGNVSDAMFLQGIALDTAAGTGKDLQTVTQALVRAQNGNIGALKRLGIPLDDAIVKNKDFAAATEALTKAYGGQAKVLGDSDPLTRLQRSYEDVLDTLGYALLPVVVEFTEYLQTDVLPEIQRWVRLNEEELQRSLQGATEFAINFAKAVVGVGSTVAKYQTAFAVFATFIAGLATLAQVNAALVAMKSLSLIVTGILTKLGLIVPAAGTAGTALTVAGNAGAAAGTKATIAWSRLLVVLGRIALPLTVIITFFQGLSWWRERYKREDAKAFAEQKIAADRYVYSITSGFKDIEDATRRARGEQDAYTQSILDGFKPIEDATKKARKAAEEEAERIARLNKLKKEQAKRDAEQARLDAKIASIKKSLNLKGENALDKESDIKQLYAAEALIKRQKDINQIDLDRVKAMKEEILSLKVRNDLASRYVDILKVISDEKITDAEVKALALGWKLPEQAVRAYLVQFQAVSDGIISDDEIIKLAMSWGSTQDQAAQYLDFYQYLNDGFLSDAEIEKLKNKWKMTEEQVRLYASFVGVVNDGKLTDAEIIKLKDQWKLTTDQIVEYIKKIGAPVTYSGTLIDPAKAAEIGWKDAKAALQSYLDLLKAGTGAGVTGAAPGTVNGNDPAVIAAAIAAANEAAAAAAEAARIAAEAEAAAAEAEAAAAASSAIFLDAIRSSTTTEAINSAVQVAQIVGESASDIANAMMVGLLGQGVDAASAGSTARYTGMAIAAQQAAESKAKADAEAAARALSSGMIRSRDLEIGPTNTPSFNDYDERFRFGAFSQNSTVNTAKGISGGNLMAAPVINITVEGSVTAEQDLVQTVRNGLLATQYNGNSINLQAI